MEHKNEGQGFEREREILFSQAVKAGKRIYYLDVKKNKRGEMYLCVTESKKVAVDGDENGLFNFEKHKIFLYPEDFGKFINAFSNAVSYIHQHDVGPFEPVALEEVDEEGVETDENERMEEPFLLDEMDNEIDIKIDF